MGLKKTANSIIQARYIRQWWYKLLTLSIYHASGLMKYHDSLVNKAVRICNTMDGYIKKEIEANELY